MCHAIVGLLLRPTIFELFRIVCEYTIAHTYALEELDSSYDNCGTMFCDRPEADVDHGCPDCLVSQLVKELKEDCEIAFDSVAATKRDRRLSELWPWSFEKLQQDVSIISSADASVDGKGYSPDWTMRIKTLVSIMRGERYKAHKARMLEITNKNGGRRDTE